MAVMSDYRRYFIPGGTYFFTVVTERRVRIFDNEQSRQILGNVVRECLSRRPAEVMAVVLLPDHLHTLWTMPTGDEIIRRVGDGLKGNSRERGLLLAARSSPAAHPVATNAAAACGSAGFGNTWSEMRRSRSPFRLHPLQPRKARTRAAAGRLALVELSSLGARRPLFARLGIRQS
jgi:hypothetical protein